jgi:signal transduction histidine kinase
MVTPNQHTSSVQPPADELNKLKSENSALKTELAEARKSNQQYLQNVAHQLTAPLGAIKWSIRQNSRIHHQSLLF